LEKFIQNGSKIGATSHPIVLDVWQYKQRSSIVIVEFRSSFYSLLLLILCIYMVFKCWDFDFYSFMLAWIGRPKLFTREEKALLSKKKPDLEVATSVSIPCLTNNDWCCCWVILVVADVVVLLDWYFRPWFSVSYNARESYLDSILS
jgi:hypothetical protein